MASRDGKDSNTGDAALFRRTVAGTRPLKTRTRHEPQTPPPPAKALQRRRDERTLMHETLAPEAAYADIETGEELSFRRDGIAATTFRKLKRGGFSVAAALDLHGMKRDEAQRELRAFLVFCTDKGLRCVRVVHGKGNNSGHGGPVLKKAVNTWLRNWDEVLAFSSAPPRDGGSGAVYVLLRAR